MEFIQKFAKLNEFSVIYFAFVLNSIKISNENKMFLTNLICFRCQLNDDHLN